MNRFLPAGILLAIILLYVSSVSAAEFKVWKIGSLNTGGKLYNIWYYSGVNPILSGTAGDGSNVDIYIDDTVRTIRAEDNGNWLYRTENLKSGTHHITISSESNSYSFTLIMDPAAVASASAQMPVTGGSDLAMIASGVGVILLGSGYFLRKKTI